MRDCAAAAAVSVAGEGGVAVSVIVVNWNGKRHLPGCLESLRAQSYRDFEVILVDNGSADGSLELVRAGFPWVRTVALPENRGFAGGNNAGMEQAAGAYLVTLNNDTEVDPGWLEELVAVAQAHPEAGMVASRICSFDDRDLVDSLGVAVCLDGMSRAAARRRRFSSLSVPKTAEVLLPSGCAALYRREMLQEVGLFDERFFAYCEDTDLGLRGRLAGWQALLARDAVVYHKYSQTAGAFSPLKLYLVERNHYWVALKSYPVSWLLLLPFATCWRFLEQARAVLLRKGTGAEFAQEGGKLRYLTALFRGTAEGWLGIPYCLAARGRLRPVRRVGDREVARLLRAYRLTFKELLDAG